MTAQALSAPALLVTTGGRVAVLTLAEIATHEAEQVSTTSAMGARERAVCARRTSALIAHHSKLRAGRVAVGGLAGATATHLTMASSQTAL